MSDDDEYAIHNYLHHADRWTPWQRGSGAARRIARQMMRIRRNQRDRDAHDLGCRCLGGES